jgi:hypothetical protein
MVRKQACLLRLGRSLLNRFKSEASSVHWLGRTCGSFLRALVKGGGSSLIQNVSNDAVACSQEHIRALQGMSVSNQAEICKRYL